MRSLAVTRVSTLSKFALRNPGVSVSALFLLAAVMVALIGPTLGTGDPNAINADATFGSPSGDFLLGNDHLGRSVLARLVSALRISLLLATLSGLLAALAGTLVGVTVGYYGGLLDELVMRFVDMLFAFPWLLMAILVAAALGTGTQSVVVAIVVVMFPSFSRIVRGPTLSVRERGICNRGPCDRGLAREDSLPPPGTERVCPHLDSALVHDIGGPHIGRFFELPRPWSTAANGDPGLLDARRQAIYGESAVDGDLRWQHPRPRYHSHQHHRRLASGLPGPEDPPLAPLINARHTSRSFDPINSPTSWGLLLSPNLGSRGGFRAPYSNRHLLRAPNRTLWRWLPVLAER